MLCLTRKPGEAVVMTFRAGGESVTVTVRVVREQPGRTVLMFDGDKAKVEVLREELIGREPRRRK